ncbi:hypothetical protein TUMEXPCC7403_19050 [Tumidithrix helvetica PCC 7403]|uniref:hypothetical protein n=1 Tax=Tumidithrix helvetica TaxID=3457545 RepID=UPI003C81A04B
MKLSKAIAGIFGIASVLGIASSAQAASITGITGFQTFGDQMTGMQVKVTYTDNSTSSAVWAATGAGSGGASTSDWSLSQTGDTFGGDWTFINTGSKTISSLFINAITGSTVFDQTDPSPGTPDSAQGITFAAAIGFLAPDFVEYGDIVNVNGNPAVGDIYGNLTLTWRNGFATNQRLVFDADTDTVARPVPVPGLAVGAILAAGVFSGAEIKRRKAQAKQAQA